LYLLATIINIRDAFITRIGDIRTLIKPASGKAGVAVRKDPDARTIELINVIVSTKGSATKVILLYARTSYCGRFALELFCRKLVTATAVLLYNGGHDIRFFLSAANVT
jgi:hypothetical protein